MDNNYIVSSNTTYLCTMLLWMNDDEGNLIVCQHGDRRIASLSNGNDQKSDFKTVVDNYDGMRLNSPNDLVMSKNGIIYFTDPPFAFFNLETSEFIDSELKELDFSGVFKYDPETNQTYIKLKPVLLFKKIYNSINYDSL